MTDADESRRAEIAVRAAEAGATVAAESFRTDHEVETKSGKTDVVTEADRDAQRAVVEAVREEYPEDPIVGEEDDRPTAVPDEGPAWVVDPIDGTANYVRGFSVFATAVAAVVDGDPVAGAVVFPALSDTYRSGPDGAFLNDAPIAVSDRDDPETCAVCPTLWGFDRRDEYADATRAIVDRFGEVRRLGCAQAVLSMIAGGAFEGAITTVTPAPWDTLAGVHLIREAGGVVTDLEGDRFRHDSTGLVASNGAVHEAVLEAAREVAR